MRLSKVIAMSKAYSFSVSHHDLREASGDTDDPSVCRTTLSGNSLAHSE